MPHSHHRPTLRRLPTFPTPMPHHACACRAFPASTPGPSGHHIHMYYIRSKLLRLFFFSIKLHAHASGEGFGIGPLGIADAHALMPRLSADSSTVPVGDAALGAFAHASQRRTTHNHYVFPDHRRIVRRDRAHAGPHSCADKANDTHRLPLTQVTATGNSTAARLPPLGPRRGRTAPLSFTRLRPYPNPVGNLLFLFSAPGLRPGRHAGPLEAAPAR